MNDETFAYYDSVASSFVSWPLPSGHLNPDDEIFLSERGAIDECIKKFAVGRVLDLGCGSGRNISVYGPSVEWIGLVDQSDLMLSHAISTAQKFLPVESIFSTKNTLPEWNPPNHLQADRILCSFLISHLNDAQINELLRKAMTCLTNGGQILLIDSLWHVKVDTTQPDILEIVTRQAGNDRPHRVKKRYFSTTYLDALLSDKHFVVKEFTGKYFIAWRVHAPECF